MRDEDTLVNHNVLFVLHDLVSVLVVVLVMVRVARLGRRGGRRIGVSILRRRFGLTNRGFFWPRFCLWFRTWLGLLRLLRLLWRGGR